jgi:hypothetical protein
LNFLYKSLNITSYFLKFPVKLSSRKKSRKVKQKITTLKIREKNDEKRKIINRENFLPKTKISSEKFSSQKDEKKIIFTDFLQFFSIFGFT